MEKNVDEDWILYSADQSSSAQFEQLKELRQGRLRISPHSRTISWFISTIEDKMKQSSTRRRDRNPMHPRFPVHGAHNFAEKTV